MQDTQKQQILSILQSIDDKEAGQVNAEVFFSLLPLHHIDIDSSLKQLVAKFHIQNQNKINYKQALETIQHHFEKTGKKSNLLANNTTTSFNQSFSTKISHNSALRSSQIKQFQTSPLTHKNAKAQYDTLADYQPYKEINYSEAKSQSLKMSPRTDIQTNQEEDPFMSQSRLDFKHPATMAQRHQRQNSLQARSRMDDIANKTQLIITFPNEIKKMSETEPQKFAKVYYMLRSLQQAGIDVRCLEILRAKLNSMANVTIHTLRQQIVEQLKIHTAKSYLADLVIEAFQAWNSKEINDSSDILGKESLNDFLNMCHYWPLTVKRLSNASSNMYRVLNANKANDYQTSLELLRQQQELKQTQVYKLLTLLNSKLHEKFDKLVDAYLFFSGNKMTKITLSEFRICLENLRIKLPTLDVTLLFEHLDEDQDGQLSYREFCNLAEERWKGIDPFDHQTQRHTQQHFMKQRSQSINYQTPEDIYTSSFSVPPQLEELHEPQSFEKDAMIASYNLYRGYKNRTIKREQMMSNSFGVKSLKSDDIRDVLANAFETSQKKNVRASTHVSYTERNQSSSDFTKQSHSAHRHINNSSVSDYEGNENKTSKPVERSYSPQKLATINTIKRRDQQIPKYKPKKLEDLMAENIDQKPQKLAPLHHISKISHSPDTANLKSIKRNQDLDSSVLKVLPVTQRQTKTDLPSSRAENDTRLQDYFATKRQLKPT